MNSGLHLSYSENPFDIATSHPTSETPKRSVSSSGSPKTKAQSVEIDASLDEGDLSEVDKGTQRIKRVPTTISEKEAKNDQLVQEKLGEQREREQIRAKIQLFNQKFRLLYEEISAEIALQRQELRSESEAEALAERMRSLRLEFEDLTGQYTEET